MPECLYAAPEKLNWSAAAGAGSAVRELAHAFGIPVYLGTDNQDAGYRLYCRAFDRRRRNRYQLARHFLTRGVHVIQGILHPDDISSLQRWRRNRLLLLNTFYPHTRAGRTWLRDAQQLRRCL
ncbi:MAG: hypothetical protein ACLRXB_08765 [Escherichia coli]